MGCYGKNDLVIDLYKGLVRPLIDYGNLIYYPVTKKNKQMVENAQRRATRIIPELKGFSYEHRLRALNLQSLEYRREPGDMIQVFKLIHKIDDFDYWELFKITVSNHEIRGHIYKLQKLRSYKSIRQNSFAYRIVNSWNTLPSDIVTSKSVNEFKSKLDNHWKGKRYNIDNIY